MLYWPCSTLYSDDEGEPDEDEEEEEEVEDEENGKEMKENGVKDERESPVKLEPTCHPEILSFLSSPTAETLLKLGDNRTGLIQQHVNDYCGHGPFTL